MSRNVANVSFLSRWEPRSTPGSKPEAFSDKFIALHTGLELTDETDVASLGKIQEHFKKFIDEYAQAVLPT